MFGKKKFSREELEQAEKNIEQGNQLLLEFSGKKDFLLSQNTIMYGMMLK